MVRYPSKADMLRFLRGVGIPVGTIIDVGAREETLELRQAFPDLRHILFEPASEFHDALRTNYASMDYVLVPAALSDHEGRGYLRKIAIGNKISHSWLVDEASDEALVAFYARDVRAIDQGGKVVTTMRLDSFMSTRDDAKPYLLKLDVDGLEIPIMQGSEGIWDDVSCVIVEATIASFAERMNFLLAKGFKLFDIVDHCYYYGMFSQVDLVFVAEKHWENPDLRPWETKKFTSEQYVHVADFVGIVQKSTPVESRRFPLPWLKFWKRRANSQ